MFKKLNHLCAYALLASLILQPAVSFAHSLPQESDDPVSTQLNSPLRMDIALLKKLSTTPVLNNGKVFQLYTSFFNLDEEIVRTMANRHEILANSAFDKYFTNQELINKTSRIQLFNNLQFANQDNQNSIVKGLGKTITKAGQLAFLSLVAQEHTDWALTHKRQQFIRALVQSPQLLKNLQVQLTKIKECENDLCQRMLFAQSSSLTSLSLKQQLIVFALTQVFIILGAQRDLKNIAIANILMFLAWPLLKKICSAEIVRGGGRLAWNIARPLIMLGLSGYAAATLLNFKDIAGANRPEKLLFNVMGDPTPLTIEGKLLRSLMAGALVYTFYAGLQDEAKTNEELFNNAKGIAQLIKAAEELEKTIVGNPNAAISSAYPAISQLQTSADYKKLLSKAKKGTFNPTNTYGMFSVNMPRVEDFITLLNETIPDFSKVLRMYGELDAYASMAQLYLDTQAQTNAFGEKVTTCFVDLIENSDESILRAQGMWHPIIPQLVVRTNSITLGGDKENPRNAIITGPNAAGKSISMKALLVNIILGQTFGMACAESFAFTPYTKIIGQFTTSDNSAASQSKFMAEATNVVNLLKELESLKPHEKAFVITDELFSGTEVKPAIALSVELCVEIAAMKNVSYLLATHYKDLTKIKELTDGAFENYKVSAFVEEDHTITYPFKLVKGLGKVNVAFDIFLDQMRKQGLANKRLEAIIQNARERNLTAQS